jgi:hypothetical protein
MWSHSSLLEWREVTPHIRCGEKSLFSFDGEESLFTFDVRSSRSSLLMWRGVTLFI